MKFDKPHTVAFSGHRSFKTGEASLFAPMGGQGAGAIAERLRETVRKLAGQGVEYFLCGMAEGFDLLAGEAVLSLREEYPRLKLIAVIPFPEQAAGFDESVRRRYRRVLEGAHESVTICHSYTSNCFLRRNDWLVDNASTLVCLYNGSKGGTQYTVRRAVKNGLRVINIFDVQ